MSTNSTVETYSMDNLFAGVFHRVTEAATILTGQGELKRGAVLGKVTASGKLKLNSSDSSDGSEAVYAVLANDVDTTSGDVEAIVYLSGQFNEDTITFGANTTAASTKDAARLLNLYWTAVENNNYVGE